MNNHPRSVLFEQAVKLNLNPQKISDDGLFTVEYRGKTAYVYLTFSHLNSQLGATLATNKYLTRQVANDVGINNIPYIYTINKNQLEIFYQNNYPIIAKPLSRSQSIGVEKINNPQEFEIYIKNCILDQTIFEKYIDGYEYKNFILNGQILDVTKKSLVNPEENKWDKTVEILKQESWDKKITDQSLKLADLLHLKLCTVDFILDQTNQEYLLEVNSRVALNDFYSVDEEFGKKLANKILITILSEQLGDQFLAEYSHFI